MLKDFVRERLMAAADEIFGLFERTIAAYEEQLCRAREENEEQRRQLEAVYKSHILPRTEDVRQPIGSRSILAQEHPRALNVKEEEDDINVPLTSSVSAANCDDDGDTAAEPSHRGPNGDSRTESPPDDLFAPLSHSDDTDEHLSSDADCAGDAEESKSTQMAAEERSPTRERRRIRQKNLSCPVCAQKNCSDHNPNLQMKTSEKRVSCPFCARRFSQKAHMITHARTHTGEKPFSCSFCAKSFSRNENMSRHMRIHTGEKPFTCSLCAKSFSYKHCLKAHMRSETHVGQKL
ncbi:uncharacterized protein LOC144018708 [Festucalex cinctus]